MHYIFFFKSTAGWLIWFKGSSSFVLSFPSCLKVLSLLCNNRRNIPVMKNSLMTFLIVCLYDHARQRARNTRQERKSGQPKASPVSDSSNFISLINKYCGLNVPDKLRCWWCFLCNEGQKSASRTNKTSWLSTSQSHQQLWTSSTF